MRQTLFYIPYELAGIPMFGHRGWLLLAWIGFCTALLIWLVRRHGWSNETRGYLPFMLIVGLVIAFVLPRVEVPGHGLPVRGYGVMLLTATIAGVALAAYRARSMGLHPDLILSLAFRMFLCGIIGARLFFVIQYWDAIRAETAGQTIANMFNFVEGGLVVYGSLIGALLAAAWFVRQHHLPALVLGDLIAPSLALGLAIGRLGCLMNGCCYGGVCDHPWAVTFPQLRDDDGRLVGSPPYLQHKRLGMLHGMRLGSDQDGLPVIRQVASDGPAAELGLRVGARVTSINGFLASTLPGAERLLEEAGPVLRIVTDSGTYDWSVGQLPERSLPIHPTQIYSSANAALLCLLTLAYYPFRRRDGEVIALLLTIYAVTRFILEMIRTDEGSFYATGLTISQNVSLLVLPAVAALWIYIWLKQPIAQTAQNHSSAKSDSGACKKSTACGV